MCSNDGTLTFEVFIFPFYPKSNHPHLFLLRVYSQLGTSAAETSLHWAKKTKIGKVSIMSCRVHRTIWGLSGTIETLSSKKDSIIWFLYYSFSKEIEPSYNIYFNLVYNMT